MIRSIFIIFCSFVVALTLTIVPLPIEWGWGRPLWCGLLVIFWGIYAPNYVGLITAWIMGLFVDQLSGTTLGTHAFGLVSLAYLTSMFYMKLRLAHIPQQMLMVWVLLLLYQGWVMLMQGMIGAVHEFNWLWLLAPSTTVLLWPFTQFLKGRLYLYFDPVRA